MAGPEIAGRGLGTVVRGILTPRNLIGGLRAILLVTRPVAYLRRYLFGGGEYPADWRVRSPTGTVGLTTYSHADVLTIFVCFLRGDYNVKPEQARIVVDVGANIGISAAYFLSRSRDVEVTCIEPVPTNIQRLRRNLEPFDGRYRLVESAVADFDGDVAFGVEPTGVFGGIGVEAAETIIVPCCDVNGLLSEDSNSGPVDVLKLDIEGMEVRVAEAIDASLVSKIDLAFLEAEPDHDLWPGTHRQQQRGAICVLERKVG